jgi:hypothetical protein
MGENTGFLLPAWLLLAPLVLAFGDMLLTSRHTPVVEAEAKPVVARPAPSLPQQAP